MNCALSASYGGSFATAGFGGLQFLVSCSLSSGLGLKIQTPIDPAQGKVQTTIRRIQLNRLLKIRTGFFGVVFCKCEVGQLISGFDGCFIKCQSSLEQSDGASLGAGRGFFGQESAISLAQTRVVRKANHGLLEC